MDRNHDMGTQITKDDSAWVEIERAKAELAELMERMQPLCPIISGARLRAMIGNIQDHLATALELHSAYRHTHAFTVPPVVAGAVSGLEELAGMFRVGMPVRDSNYYREKVEAIRNVLVDAEGSR